MEGTKTSSENSKSLAGLRPRKLVEGQMANVNRRRTDEEYGLQLLNSRRFIKAAYQLCKVGRCGGFKVMPLLNRRLVTTNE